jgi:hypothetical protein
MNACELVSLVTATSCAIAKCVPKEDLPLITAVFGQIASTLATITVQEEVLEAINTPPNVTPGSEVIITTSLN